MAKLEGRFDELSPRIDALQRQIEGLRTDMQAGDAALQHQFEGLRSELSGFKTTILLAIAGSWLTMIAVFIASRFIE